MVGTDDSLVVEIKAGYLADPRFASIPVGHKLDSHGLYRFDGKIAIPAVSSIKQRLLQPVGSLWVAGEHTLRS